MQVAGEAAEPARRLLITIRWYRDENLLRANIDASRIRLQYHRSALPLLCSLRHGLLLVAGERGRFGREGVRLYDIFSSAKNIGPSLIWSAKRGHVRTVLLR
jgi:hypothetical protein